MRLASVGTVPAAEDERKGRLVGANEAMGVGHLCRVARGRRVGYRVLRTQNQAGAVPVPALTLKLVGWAPSAIVSGYEVTAAPAAFVPSGLKNGLDSVRVYETEVVTVELAYPAGAHAIAWTCCPLVGVGAVVLPVPQVLADAPHVGAEVVLPLALAE